MTLQAGTQLGAYEILEPLGAGGMGEVYGARDRRLGRVVAIKVLPGSLAADERRRQRFEREARALAALSHPHICAIHDVGHENGISFLVLERVEGETLAARLARGALPPREAARLGAQIADALDQAHRRGVIHRDLKPANVMLTRDGVKLLDFGLARAVGSVAASPGGADPDEPPTRTEPLTMDGTIVGTVPYMAPEQLEGREADPRTDVFALGAVLYEMVTGRRAFDGASSASVIAAILTTEPPGLTTASPLAPPALERAVARCLAKNPDQRWQSARDLALELSWIANSSAGADSDGAAAVPAARRSRERLVWAAALGVLAIALGWSVLRPQTDGRVRAPARFGVAPPQVRSLSLVRVAPDGRHLSFTATAGGGVSQLWLRPLDSVTARALAGTEGASWHFWSPDSRHIAFLAEGKLKRIDITGGSPRIVCPAPGSGPFRLGAWSPDGTIVFRVDEAPGQRQGLFRVPADGGAAVPLDIVDEAGAALDVVWPSFLPDGRRFLCMCWPKGAPSGDVSMCVASLETGRGRRVHDVPSYAEYVPSGYVVYSEASSLFAQPLDLRTLRVHGEPLRIAEGLASWNGIGPPEFSLSSNGILVYQALSGQTRLTWKDRSGRELGHVGQPGIYDDVRLAPDGRRAAVTKVDAKLGTSDVWLVELDRNVATRFTSEGPDAVAPVWSADGTQIVYCRPVDAPPFLHAKQLGGGVEEVFLASTGSLQCPGDWSPDGRVLLFMDRHPDTGFDLWMLETGSRRTATPLLRTPFREYLPSFSPDGHWIAYVSDESGQPEVYLLPFPGPGERFRVSVDGGTLPRWRRDGRELFYQDPGDRLMAVPIVLGPAPSIGAPVPLFDLGSAGFDASADGNRFLVLVPEPGASPEATLVLHLFPENW